MAYAPRSTNIHHPLTSNTSLTGGHTSTSTSSLRQPSQSLLQTRINAKRAELEHLRQLRDLSANLANQLSTLETKLSTLRDGTQSVALVLANWENVLRAISMAAMKVPRPLTQEQNDDEHDGGDGEADGGDDTETKMKRERQKLQTRQNLPVPLVRIPVQPKEEGG